MNQVLTPSLRFEEFKDNWESKNLKDVFELKYGKDHKHLNQGIYPMLGSGGIMRYVDSYLYNQPSVLIGRKGTIDKPLFITTPFWTVDTLFYTIIKQGQEPYFVYSLVQTINWYKYNEATGVPSLNTSGIYSVPVYVPLIKEQQKIASFLTLVDSKISQLTEKHRLLKEYKKGVMQQIFSQQLRFKDEDGEAFPEWEEKTIGNVMKESRIKGNGGDIAKKLTVRIWGKGVVAKKDDGKGSENTQYYKRKAGQFIYGKLDFLNCAFAIIPEELDGLESTLDLPSLDVSNAANKFFILERVKQKSFYKQFGDIADGSRKAKRINVSVFQSMPINLPIKDEQDKIMNFLQSIDNKTDAVAQQVEQTKQFKKGLLQQMFV